MVYQPQLLFIDIKMANPREGQANQSSIFVGVLFILSKNGPDLLCRNLPIGESVWIQLPAFIEGRTTNTVLILTFNVTIKGLWYN